MQYVSLKKYFHMNERKCNEVYMKRLESESCRRLGIEIHQSECFYIVTEEMVNLIIEIYSMNTWIERKLNSFILPYSAHSYLIMKSLIEEIRSSNRIEGIYSTRQELEEMMNMDSPQKYKRFYGMVSQYSKLTSEKFQPIESCSMIRKLYDNILLKDVVKENEQDAIDGIVFRKGDVEIHSGTKTIHKGVCGEKNIIDMMEKSLKILNHEHIPLLIRVAIFHYLFEYIHPFYNGNGRMGRFMSSGYLSTELNILCALQFSIACHHHQKKYYDAFEVTNDMRNKSDLTVFIIEFLEIYLSGLHELKESMNSTIDIYLSLKNKIDEHMTHKHKVFMKFLLEVTLFGPSHGVSMAHIVKVTLKTEQSIRSHIKEINKEHTFIDIDKSHKPYMYKMNIDTLALL